MNRLSRFASRLRQPAYTGQNRCLPCTVVNGTIAVVAAAAVGTAVLSLTTAPLGVAAGLGTFGAAAVLIYFRGYLIPGTPTLTKRYFPERLLAAFGKTEPVPARTDGGFDQEAVLVEAGALEELPDGSDLRLVPEFRTEWYEEMDRVAAESDYGGLFRILNVEDGTISVDRHGDSLQAEVDGSFAGIWKSREAFVADVAGATVLSARAPDWTEFGAHDRHELLSGLRLFIDECPTCGVASELGSETVETCCDSRTVATLDCPDCGARLFESPG